MPPGAPDLPTTTSRRPTLEDTAPGPTSGSSSATRSPEASPTPGRLRSASLKLLESTPPLGVWQASGFAASKAPTLDEIRRGSYTEEGWLEEGQLEQRGHTPHEIHRRKLKRVESARRQSTSAANTALHETTEEHTGAEPFPTTPRASTWSNGRDASPRSQTTFTVGGAADTRIKTPTSSSSIPTAPASGPDSTGLYPNGYRFPPKPTWKQSLYIGMKAFWSFFCTPLGFLVTIYSLNVVAWGAMIFFVLLNAAPALCHPGGCNGEYSLRKIWIEIDSQVLNGLFCVTGFGLAPWRFRDLYWLIQWRVFKNKNGFRRLAGVNAGWFRLPGSDQLPEDLGPPATKNKTKQTKAAQTSVSGTPPEQVDLTPLLKNPALPLPPSKIPPAPLTGFRAPPSKPYLLDVVVYVFILNTLFQVVLAAFMWTMTRFNRPSWATGLFICLGCISGMVAGWITYREGKRVKQVEGVKPSKWLAVEDQEADLELGVQSGHGMSAVLGEQLAATEQRGVEKRVKSREGPGH